MHGACVMTKGRVRTRRVICGMRLCANGVKCGTGEKYLSMLVILSIRIVKALKKVGGIVGSRRRERQLLGGRIV